MGVETKAEYPFSVDTWTEISKRKPFHFLTHAHKDHTGGIDSHGTYPIYCTSLTKRLVCRRYPKLNRSMFKLLEIGEPKFIPNEDEGFTVTAFDANHCPGAVMLLFEGPFGNVLHTGDCRLTIECLNQLPKRPLDYIYLDCTFGNETMAMPSKEDAIEQVKRCIWNHPIEAKVYLACDMLGQETLLEDVAKTFGVKIFVDKERLSNYYADLEVVAPDFLTAEKESTRFEICEGFPRLYERATQAMQQARKDRRVEPLFIRPSAQWYTYEERLQGDGSGVIGTTSSFRFGGAKRRSVASSGTQATRDDYGVWHVCYSMHSSRGELQRALERLNPVEVISTTPHCGVCDLAKSALPTNPGVNKAIEAVERCVLEDRELKKGRRYYSCSPSKVSNAVDSPIPLFGSAQFALPPSPQVPFPSPCPSVSSLLPSDSLRSQNVRAKRLFVEPELDKPELDNPELIVESCSGPTKSLSQTPSKRCSIDESDSKSSSPSVVDSSPSSYIRSVSLPNAPSVSHGDSLSHDVRSKSLSLPSRRKLRIPDPLPSVLNLKRNGE